MRRKVVNARGACNLLRMSCDSAVVGRIKTVVASPENVSAVSGSSLEVAIDFPALMMAISTPSFVKRHAVANKLQTRALLIAVNLVAGLSIFFFGYDQGENPTLLHNARAKTDEL